MTTSNMSIGRQIKTAGGRVVGIVSCLPSMRVGNRYFVDRFGESGIKNIVKMIGVEHRRWTDEQTTTSDLCRAAAKKILQDLDWEPGSVDALIFFSQTPDYRLPASACALQADLGLSSSCIAFDVNLGCSGYPYALWLGMTLLQQGAAKRVLLAVGDTLSKLVDKEDRATAMLFGDAGTVTALEADDGDAFFVLGTDGRGARNLMVPSGGFKKVTENTDSRLAGKRPEFLFMDGSEIFNFTLKVVPNLIEQTIHFHGTDVKEYDAFLFHQANLFMLNHLVAKSKIPVAKVPINLTEYGNTSCASIPLLISSELSKMIKQQPMLLAMFGFGVGFSWAAASLRVGPLVTCEVIAI